MPRASEKLRFSSEAPETYTGGLAPERPSIVHLLPSHTILLQRHRRRLVELTAVAVRTGLNPQEMAFLIANAEGEFGRECLHAGYEFLIVGANESVMVVPLDVPGLLVTLGAVIPEAAEPVLRRLAGTSPVVLVDGADEPAVVLIDVSELRDAPCL